MCLPIGFYVIAHKLSFVWIANTASGSQSTSFCFLLYIRVLVAVRAYPQEIAEKKKRTELEQ